MSVLDEMKVTLNEVERKTHVITPTSGWDDDIDDDDDKRERGRDS